MEPPIFVVGTPRSGTTLIAKILGRHPKIFMPGETDFFEDIYSRAKQLGDPRDPSTRERIVARLLTLYGRFYHPVDQERIDRLFSSPELVNQLSSAHDYVDLFTNFMCIQMRSDGKSRWGNNVPKDIFNLDAIVSFYPNAKIVMCVRDIRDFLISYKNFWRVGSSDVHARRKKALYHPVITSLLWKATAKQILIAQARLLEQVILIRYESLVKQPEQVIRILCEFVGIAYNNKMLDVDWENSSFQERRRGIFTTSIGRWRNGLSGEEVYLAQKIAGREMKMLGYEVDQTNYNKRKIVGIIAMTPYALWKALSANTDHRGSTARYALTRLTSLFWRV